MESKKNQYKVEDWAGNTMFDKETFETYADGWAYIYEHIEDKDNAYDDLIVVRKDEEKIKRIRNNMPMQKCEIERILGIEVYRLYCLFSNSIAVYLNGEVSNKFTLEPIEEIIDTLTADSTDNPIVMSVYFSNKDNEEFYFDYEDFKGMLIERNMLRTKDGVLLFPLALMNANKEG